MKATAGELFPLISGLTFRGGVRKRHYAILTLPAFQVKNKAAT